MNTHYHIRLFTTTVMLAIVSGWLTSCKEEIDDSNRYTFTDETVLSYLEKDLNLIEGRPVSPEHQFSEYVSLLKTVPISDMSSSTVAQLLSARGHYTVFAPNNQAIYAYRDGTVYNPTTPGVSGTTIAKKNVVALDITAGGGGGERADGAESRA